MSTITLTADEAAFIVAALMAVSPSGGGSFQHTLARRIEAETGAVEDLGLVVKLIRIAAGEEKEENTARREAIALLVDIASRWGENAEEDFIRRIKPTDTDEDCKSIAIDGGNDVEDVLEMRDLWRSTHLMMKELGS